MRAYIVVTVGPGKSRDVAPQITSLPGVKMANACGAAPTSFAVVELRNPRSSRKRGSGEASPWGKKKVSGARYSATAFLGWAVYDSYHQVLRTV